MQSMRHATLATLGGLSASYTAEDGKIPRYHDIFFFFAVENVTMETKYHCREEPHPQSLMSTPSTKSHKLLKRGQKCKIFPLQCLQPPGQY